MGKIFLFFVGVEGRLFDEMRAIARVPYMSHVLDFSRVQNLNAHDYKSEDSGDYWEFDAFAVEVDRNYEDLIAYD